MGVGPVPYPLNLMRGGKLGDFTSISFSVPNPLSAASVTMNGRMQVVVYPSYPVLSTTFLVVFAGAYSGESTSDFASSESSSRVDYGQVFQSLRVPSVGHLRMGTESFELIKMGQNSKVFAASTGQMVG